MFDMKKEKLKQNVFLVLYVVFSVLTFIGAFLVIAHKVTNAGYAVIPMLFALVFSVLYRNSKKAIRENTK